MDSIAVLPTRLIIDRKKRTYLKVTTDGVQTSQDQSNTHATHSFGSDVGRMSVA